MNYLRFLKIALLSASVVFGHEQGAIAGTLKAGAAKIDITPEPGVSLDGPISKPGPAKGVHDRLHARALVLDDGTIQLAIVVCDACMISQEVFDAAKSQIEQSGGIRSDHMLMSATHTHAAPRVAGIGTRPADHEYAASLSRKIAEAVLQAQKNLAPAQIGYGSFDKPELLACRRYLCEPGSVAANPFGETDEQISSVAGSSSARIRPAGPIDPQFSVLSVRHIDGNSLALLGNYSVHYCGGYQGGLVSADYFGYFGESIEAKLRDNGEHPGVVGIMSNGTSGNTGSFQREGKKYAPFEGMQLYGRMLAEEAVATVANIEHNDDLTFSMRETQLQFQVRRPDAARIEWANKVLQHPEEKHPHRWSRVYAQEALHLSKYPETVTLKFQAIRLGDIAIAAAPCEVFAETGLAVKNESPFPKTFTIELANGYGGYLPPERQHELGGYETWPARSSFLETTAETRIRQTLSELLSDIKN